MRFVLGMGLLLVLAAALLVVADASDSPVVAVVGAMVIGGVVLAREWWLGSLWIWGALLATAAVAALVGLLAA